MIPQKAVILTAGKGVRVWPLSSSRPKPLIRALNKSILEHNLNALSSLVNEVILVIGYKGEMIKSFLGSRYKNIKIHYVWQRERLGTGDAAKKGAALIKKNERFLLLNGDDIYFKNDIKNCLKKFPCILTARREDVSSFGQVIQNKGVVKGLIEKSSTPKSHLVNTGLFYLDKSVFDIPIRKSKRGEYEVTDYIKNLIKNKRLYTQPAKKWFPLSYSWNLLDINEFLLKREKPYQKGTIESNCRISGKVIIEKGAIIKSGAYIEGPVYIGKNSEIGPNCYIRGATTIGEGCYIGQAVEIKNSIIGDYSRISHLSYVGDSIVDENCNLGGGTITANFRFDLSNAKAKINGRLIDTKRKKFGAVFGAGTKTGIHCSLMPGVLIGSFCQIGPGTLVRENIKDKTIFYSIQNSKVKGDVSRPLRK